MIAGMFVPGLLALIGSMVGGNLNRRSAKELERRWNREESMRMLRWATEMAAEKDRSSAGMGEAVLGKLLDSSLLQPEDRPFAEAVVLAAQARIESNAIKGQSQHATIDDIAIAEIEG